MPTRVRGKGGNLPLELTSFVGRRREVSEVKRLLATSRLVTLAGVGGVGKTRLAQRVAADPPRAFPDGTWFVDLTAVRELEVLSREVEESQLLAHVVAGALGLREQSARPSLEVLAGQLAGRQLLLVLDNCEHLISACAVLVGALLPTCPDLRVLATSRESLRIAGEVIFQVSPLPVPDPDRRPALADLMTCESVALFVARAEAVLPGFSLTEDNWEAVAGICHRLDGLPLAIELASARLRVLAPYQILERLTDRFALLSGSRRAVPDRQQTLRACVEWSFELCAKQEQRLWARLAVFTGGFELDAVEGICADDELAADELLDVVAALVDRSILVCDDQVGAARYRMLETIRAFGQEKLVVAGERAELRRRHRDWYQQLVARANAEWISDRQAYWLSRLGREHPNLRAAAEFCLTEPGEAEAALRLVVSLPLLYWRVRGLFNEGRRWLDRALAQTSGATALGARALLLASHLATWQGDIDAAMPMLVEGHDLAQRLDAVTERAFAFLVRGLATLFSNDLPGAVDALEHGLTILSSAAQPDLELRLDLLNVLGVATGLAPDHERAVACQQEMLEITEPRGEGLYRSRAMWARGLVAWHQGRLTEAAKHELESLRIKQKQGSGDRYGTAQCLEALAWITASQQQHRRAATLLGAADALWADLGTPFSSNKFMIGYHDACQRQSREALGDVPFQQALDHGRSLTPDDVLAYALEQTPQPPPPSPGAVAPLTRRERQVADLVAQGLSNREIASTLVISHRTVDGHVENILAKLGFTTRTQVAAWVAAQPTPGHGS